MWSAKSALAALALGVCACGSNPNLSLAQTTTAGVPLPQGYVLHQSDHFGTNGNINGYAALHGLYCEGDYWFTDGCVINRSASIAADTQEVFQHFESVIGFAADHLEIQARGQSNGSIHSGMLVAKTIPRSFCIEARYRIPNVPGSWPSFFFWGANNTATDSELDVEQPILHDGTITPYDVTLWNHPTFGNYTIANPAFTMDMIYRTATDFSAAPHSYTTCYDDSAATVTRWIDGGLIYTTTGWQWNGPNPRMIIMLAVGGHWAGNVDPSTFSANLEVYSVEYYYP